MYLQTEFYSGQSQTLWAPSYTRRNATPGATQVFCASFSPTQLSFSHHALRCLYNKCIGTYLCANGRAGLKTRCIQANCWCYFEATEIDCAIIQLKPSLKSMLVLCDYRRIHNLCTLLITHTVKQQHTN